MSPVDIVQLEGDAIVRYAGGKAFARRPRPRAPFLAATSVSIAATCPGSCPLKPGSATGGGCYADAGMHRMIGKRMDEAARGMTSFEVILEEIALVDAAWPRGVPQDGARGGRDLRWHVFGECPTRGAAKLIGESAGRFRARGGGSSYTYTHNWREIRRRDWGPHISVLASVHSPEEALEARWQGYAPAVMVDVFPRGKRSFSYGGFDVVPCPAETLGKTCVECRLCIDVDLLKKNIGIGFKAHGHNLDAAIRSLTPLKVGGRKIA